MATEGVVVQCHRSRIDALRASLAGLPTGSAPYAGKDAETLDDKLARRLLSRMDRHVGGSKYGLPLSAIVALSHRRSRQRAAGTRSR